MDFLLFCEQARGGGSMERPVDYYRDRPMRHDRCGYTGVVALEWYERYREGIHGCPGCGALGGIEEGLQFTGDPDDPVLDDQFATEVTWFHTSTHEDWPASIDFTATLVDDTVRMMGEESAANWARRQNEKALHIGTYESAVHNLLRRMSDQGDKGKQFYLFGVHLRPGVTILPGSTTDRGWFGDVWLDEIASPEVDVVRYVNMYEDPGALSAAIRPTAIASTQRLPVPLPSADSDAWVEDASARVQAASTELTPMPAPLSGFPGLYRESPRAMAAREASEALAAGLPATMVHEFEIAVRWVEGDDPAGWASYTKSLHALVQDAERVLAELAAQPVWEV